MDLINKKGRTNMNELIKNVKKYVIDKSEKYKKEAEDSYDFWNEHIKYVNMKKMKIT